MKLLHPSRLLAFISLGIFPMAASAGNPTAVIDLINFSDNEPGFFRYYGDEGNGGSGVPMCGGRDMDNDGFNDSAIAFMTASPTGLFRAGYVDLVFGDGTIQGEMEASTLDSDVLRIYGAVRQENLGNALWMEDVTGDGLGDLILGRQNYSPTDERFGAGGLTIIVGSPALRSLAASNTILDLANPDSSVHVITFNGKDSSDRFGIWPRSGDADGDGIMDIIVGADQTDDRGMNSGETWVIRGGDHLTSETVVDISTFGAGTTLAGHMARILPPMGSNDYHLGATCLLSDLDGNGKAEAITAAALNRSGAGLDPYNPISGTTPNTGDSSGGSNQGTTFIVWDDHFPTEMWLAPYTIDLDNPPGPITSIDGSSTVATGAQHRSLGEELAGNIDLDHDGNLDLYLGDLVGRKPPGGNLNMVGVGEIFFNAKLLKGLTIDLDDPSNIPEGVKRTTIYGPSFRSIASDTIAYGDFTGDGIDDLVIGNPNDAPLARNNAGTIDILVGQDKEWPRFVDVSDGNFPDSNDLKTIRVNGAKGGSSGNNGDVLMYSAAYGDMDNDGMLDLITNEMTGEGPNSQKNDVGNLIIFSGNLFHDALLPQSTPEADRWLVQ